MYGIKPGIYRLIDEETGEEYRMVVGAHDEVRLEYQCRESLWKSWLKPKLLQEAATTPVQEPATYKFRDLQEISHATK